MTNHELYQNCSLQAFFTRHELVFFLRLDFGIHISLLPKLHVFSQVDVSGNYNNESLSFEKKIIINTEKEYV